MPTITRRRGDTYADVFVIKSKTTGEVIPLAGCSFLMTLDSVNAPGSNVGNEYQLAGVVVLGSPDQVEFAPSPEQANRVGSYFYDIQMTDATGRIRTIVHDNYIYKQDITK
jgi:hypothetical protein